MTTMRHLRGSALAVCGLLVLVLAPAARDMRRDWAVIFPFEKK